MAQATNKGIIEKPSNHSVDQTVDRLKQEYSAIQRHHIVWSGRP
jgi:hypothetical protein